MPYRYFEHISDVGIEARGATLSEAFASGVEAMLSVMFELDTVGSEVEVEVRAEAPAEDLLFVEVLNEVLSVQGRDELALKSIREVEVTEVAGVVAFRGVAVGEKMDLKRHGVKTEVKGATYSELYYNDGAGGAHVFRCVLDV